MTHTPLPDSPELTQLLEEFKRLESGFVDARKDGLFLAAKGWQREISEFAGLVNKLKVGVMSFDAMPMRDREFSLFTNTENWRTFFVSETPITGSGLDLLPECPNVVDIKISECPLRGNRLIGLRRFPNVKKVDIGWCEDADQALEYLAGLKSLEYFHIRPRPFFTGDGLAHFCGHQSICRIDFSDSRIKRGMEHLKDCPNLRELSLSHTELDDEQMKHVAGIRSLRYVYVTSSSISDTGFATFANHPHLEKIGAHGLGSDEHRQLTEKCLSHWESIPNLRSVTCAFRVTQRGLDSLKKMKNLKHLGLHWPVLTKSELEEIERQLPNCRVSAKVLE
jgi:hypothetical protein